MSKYILMAIFVVLQIGHIIVIKVLAKLTKQIIESKKLNDYNIKINCIEVYIYYTQMLLYFT